jgi:fibronectin type 3 domain-containing protein
MMRSYVALAWAGSLVWMVACVNVDKPGKVAKCEQPGSNCTVDAAAEAQDADENDDSGQDRVTDAPALHGSEAGVSDGARDRVLDVPLAVFQDAAQDVARDATGDQQIGPCWGASGPVKAGAVCRAAVGLCDLDEVCDGIHADCPADQYAPTTTVCRKAVGDCDIAEGCTGSSPDCPVDAVMTAGTLCRKAAGACDVAESCSGTDPACPADGMVPPGSTCRPSTDSNQCDPAEVCTGTSVSCPADVIYARPAAPTAAKAAVGTIAGTASISWTAPAGGAPTGYNVKRSATPTSGYTILGTQPTTTSSPYTDSGLAGGATYYYVVSSINAIATCESDNSVPASVAAVNPCTPPAAPTVTAASAKAQVSLTWPASAGATSYSVARSVTPGTGYTSATTVTTCTTACGYEDINVSNGTTYYYVVTASNGKCSSVNSVEVSGAPSCTPTAAPANLKAKANNGSVALSWDVTAGAVSYRIERSLTSGSGFDTVFTSSTASFTDATVINGTTYYYVIEANNGACLSADSAVVSALPACTPPSVPGKPTVTAGDGQVTLSWPASTGGASSYQVLRSTTSGGPYAILTSPTSTGITDTGLTDGTTYFYVVKSNNGFCLSAPSSESSATPVCTPPSAPTNLQATPSDSKVTLSWTAPTTGTVKSYVVTRTTAGADAHTDIPVPTGTTLADSSLANGTTYYYVVSASNGNCLSAPSTAVPATPNQVCALTAPTGVLAMAGNQQVTLTWPISDAGSLSYVVSRGIAAGGPYGTVVPNPNPAGTIDTAVSNGTTYYYVVTVSNGTCTSPNSTEVSAKPVCAPPDKPTNVAAIPDPNDPTSGNIFVSWTAATTGPAPTGYTVLRGTSATGPFSAASTNQTPVKFTDLGTALKLLNPNGTTYYYEVNASNAGGTCVSGNSTTVSATSCSSPTVPTGVKATAGISRVTVSWTASTNGPTSYQVKRGPAGGPFTALGAPVVNSPYIDSSGAPGTTYSYEVVARNANGVCSSANSGVVSTAPRSCTVWSGNAVNAGHPPAIGSLNGICYVSCDTITNWGCANINGDRTITINGGPLGCGGYPIPAPKTAGYNVIDVSAGTYPQATIFWGGTWVNTCSIPAGGLDF